MALLVELRRPANLLSLVRIPLGVAALACRASLVALVGLSIAAAVSDVLDGFVARRTPGDHRVGEWLDPLCDKFFVLGLCTAVVLQQRPPAWIPIATMVREMWIVPPVLLHLLAPGRNSRTLQYKARPAGKATTAAQFGVLLCLLLHLPQFAPILAIMAATCGTVAGIDYGLRARTTLRRSPATSVPVARPDTSAT